MDKIMKHRKNCYNLSRIDDGSVIDWNPNQTINDFVIDIQPYIYTPDLIYVQFNETHYQWCGPMLVIVETLAMFAGAR